MEQLVDEGLVKAIGISNFNSKQIQKVLDNCRIKPAVLQVESNLYFNNKQLIDFCQERVSFGRLGTRSAAFFACAPGSSFSAFCCLYTRPSRALS